LKVTGQSLTKENEGVVKSASRRVTQKFKTTEKCIEDDSSISIQDNEMSTRACKREYAEFNDGSKYSGSELETSVVAKRRKLDGDQRLAASNEFSSPKSSLPCPFSAVKCKIEPITNADIPGGQEGTSCFSESEVILKKRVARNGASSASSQTMSEQQQGMVSIHCLGRCTVMFVKFL